MPSLDLNSTELSEYNSADALIDEAYGSGVTTDSGSTVLLQAQSGWSDLNSDNQQVAKDGLKRFFSILFRIISTSQVQFVDNETMSPTGTTWNLSNTPSPSTSLKIYRNGIREYNFALSSNVVTLTVARGSDHITADYRI